MKPRIFLSHSKADKMLIEKLANDLRSARIDVWYDEWEIPSGESFRQQIVKGIEETVLGFSLNEGSRIFRDWREKRKLKLGIYDLPLNLPRPSLRRSLFPQVP